MIQIGKYTPASARCPAQIQREFYGQGYIVKDEPAFLSQTVFAMCRNCRTACIRAGISCASAMSSRNWRRYALTV